MRTIALIDYGSGNLHSAARALTAASNIAQRTREVRVTADPDVLRYADRIVLPGVGHFADCAAGLRARDGVVEALEEQVIEGGKPFLGICVGMQLMAARGLEDGETPGLGWVAGDVAEIAPGGGLRVPHMGWNQLNVASDHPVLEGLGADAHAYFVHSYALTAGAAADIAATTDYGGPVTACVAKQNLFGAQFHPEKSQKTGLRLLANWIRWEPE